ncbi:hypothetical protein NQ317_017959 [Molorchus minor]|uniref:Uncharacterized protein n=1 Tax=Molorchus minor TaxID=1323400 RepID=A0ABQ9JNZ0_9CUCU|nr:hypothetical protein NQ317_017959 [Molorchus minor]
MYVYADASHGKSPLDSPTPSSLLNSEHPPTKVVKPNLNYSAQEESTSVKMVWSFIYPPTVLKRTCFEQLTLREAENKFIILKDKLPVFVEVVKEMCNVHDIQKICDTLSEHPSWTLAHLAAYFGACDSFNDPKINCFLNSTDYNKGNNCGSFSKLPAKMSECPQ